MDKLTPEQEAERLYPYHPQNDEVYTDSMVTNIQRSAHITAARMHMGEVDKYKKLLEAEGYCTMCHEKKKKRALLVCDTCYDSFDGDRRSFWDDNFIH